ncbi:MAG TPA: bifunctional hydroxymethylpyrimidine kinase/phosphomethylpyrimidine kinase, partial [Acidimicrobiales bacterium]|nr:bifunctional hydroxymethylpyrimidine kinase/phosphomethylpyrimidine kinase [Acidimicrobiales bacterium]
AALLLGVDVASLATTEAMADAATALRATGASCVVVKGGHLLDDGAALRAPDVVVNAEGTATLDGPRIATRNDHGTGCSLAAAIAVGLAEGLDAFDALVRAPAFVADALAGSCSWELGAGHGPIDHLGWGADT